MKVFSIIEFLNIFSSVLLKFMKKILACHRWANTDIIGQILVQLFHSTRLFVHFGNTSRFHYKKLKSSVLDKFIQWVCFLLFYGFTSDFERSWNWVEIMKLK